MCLLNSHKIKFFLCRELYEKLVRNMMSDVRNGSPDGVAGKVTVLRDGWSRVRFLAQHWMRNLMFMGPCIIFKVE